ncbi:MAG: hypothetical protein WKG32_24105 [Gemmatimonadaceae bacterium]
MIATGQYVPEPMQLYEIWFALGAIAFGASTWRYSGAAQGGPERGSHHTIR